jgi:single-strand DNA-binding protein
MSVNKAILVGNVGNDPEIRHIEGGDAVANFSLATSETYKDRNGEKVTNTEWHRVVAWRKQAEVIEKYVKKGQQLYIEGSIKTRSWEDKDGNKRYTTEITAFSIQMLGRKGETTDTSTTANDSPQPSAPVEPEPESDLPF